EIVTNTGSMLSAKITCLHRFLVPHVYARHEHQFVLVIKQLDTEVFLLGSICTRTWCIEANLTHGREPQEMSASDEHMSRNRFFAIDRTGSIWRQNVIGKRRNFRA